MEGVHSHEGNKMHSGTLTLHCKERDIKMASYFRSLNPNAVSDFQFQAINSVCEPKNLE